MSLYTSFVVWTRTEKIWAPLFREAWKIWNTVQHDQQWEAVAKCTMTRAAPDCFWMHVEKDGVVSLTLPNLVYESFEVQLVNRVHFVSTYHFRAGSQSLAKTFLAAIISLLQWLAREAPHYRSIFLWSCYKCFFSWDVLLYDQNLSLWSNAKFSSVIALSILCRRTGRTGRANESRTLSQSWNWAMLIVPGFLFQNGQEWRSFVC